MKRKTIIQMAGVLFMICITSGLSTVEIISQQMPEQYREKFANSFPIRKDQHLEIKAYVDKVLEEDVRETMTSFKPDFFSIEDYENSLYPLRKELGDYFG